MTVKEEVMEFITTELNTLVMFWSQELGWNTVSNQSDLFMDENELEKGLEGIQDIVFEEDLAVYQIFWRNLEEGMRGENVNLTDKKAGIEVRMKDKEQGYSYHKIECWIRRDEQGIIKKMMVIVTELDAEEVYRIQLAHQITSDRNPAIFIRRAKEEIMRYPDQKYAVIQFDVQGFKVLNEVYGEDRGDEVLAYFIDVLKIVCKKHQVYSRLSADVFMIVTSYESVDEISAFIEQLNKKLLGYKGMSYRVVFGVCFVEDPREGLRKYGDSAALARQSIKEDALKHVAFYKNEMKDQLRTKKFVEDNMEQALEQGQFQMYLQPKYSISKEEMVGAEALVRWIHPDRGIISPMEFIPILEKNGFVIKMDQYIWEEACKVVRKWIDAGVEPVPISVNVSRRHLKDQEFIRVLNELIEKYQIPKKYLEIEITETIEEGEINKSVAELKENGYTLLMDDFGSGYSSLNMLKDTKFDVIKIDRGFLQDFIGSERGQKIVEHTIKMTKSIGLDMVAEGVETKEQAIFLQSCGCDTAQGFYYARPMKLEDFNEKMVTDYSDKHT